MNNATNKGKLKTQTDKRPQKKHESIVQVVYMVLLNHRYAKKKLPWFDPEEQTIQKPQRIGNKVYLKKYGERTFEKTLEFRQSPFHLFADGESYWTYYHIKRS